MEQPHRALTLRLEVEADNLKEMEMALDYILHRAWDGEFPQNSIFGDIGSGGWYDWSVRGITHDEYVSQLYEYFKQLPQKV
jgi:hypothetical protein